jgi:predicted RecB family nuclease
MKKEASTIYLSASDLSGHIACPHLTHLDLRALNGEIKKQFFEDPTVELLKERGMEFEKKYLSSIKSKGLSIRIPDNDADFLSINETRDAMEKGFDVIYQANLQMGRWRGRADFLMKVPVPSKLGTWSYEVIDSKLARETRTGTILQLCLYSEMIGDIQGMMPEHMHVITPEEELSEHHFRINEFISYYRHVKSQLETSVDKAVVTQTYPLPCSHCAICDWWKFCDDQRRRDDHLSLVAGLATSHVKEINRWPLATLEQFAEHKFDSTFKPSRGAKGTYERLCKQAAIQFKARKSGQAEYECLELEKHRGIYRLPEPSPGDIFD